MKLDKLKEKNYKDISSLISAIIFFIIGSIIFANPNNLVTYIAYIIGGILLVISLVKIGTYYYKKGKEQDASIKELSIGLIAFILGLALIIFSSTIEALIRIIIGAWILFNGITLLINSIKGAKNKSNSSKTLIVLSGFMIVCGIYMILVSNLAFKMIGLCIILYSIVEIIGYIYYSQNN